MMKGLAPLGGSNFPTNAFLVRRMHTESTIMGRISYLDQDIKDATFNGDIETIISLCSEREEFSKKLLEIKNNLKRKR